MTMENAVHAVVKRGMKYADAAKYFHVQLSSLQSQVLLYCKAHIPTRKGGRKKYKETNMGNAIRAVLGRGMSYKDAADLFGVPMTSLRLRVLAYCQAHDIKPIPMKKGRRRLPSIFSFDEQDKLIADFHKFDDLLCGLKTVELKILAYQLTEKKCVECPTIAEKTSINWVDGFLDRVPTLSLHEPQDMSLTRTRCFEGIVIDIFYDSLNIVYKKYDFTADRIYNVGEIAFSACTEHFCKTNPWKVEIGSPDERNRNTTIRLCASASGNYLPPLFVFTNEDMMNSSFMKGAPPGSWRLCHPSGSMPSDIFLRWFQWFVDVVRPTEKKPVFLLDGNATHIDDPKVIVWGLKNHVVILAIPPPCTHCLQPLDVSVMQPLSTAYSNEIKEWLQENSGRALIPSQIAGFFGKAMMKAATTYTAVEGFRKCGIWPFDRKVLEGEESELAEGINQPISPEISANSPIDVYPSPPNTRVESFSELHYETVLSIDPESVMNHLEPAEHFLQEPPSNDRYFDAPDTNFDEISIDDETVIFKFEPISSLDVANTVGKDLSHTSFLEMKEYVKSVSQRECSSIPDTRESCCQSVEATQQPSPAEVLVTVLEGVGQQKVVSQMVSPEYQVASQSIDDLPLATRLRRGNPSIWATDLEGNAAENGKPMEFSATPTIVASDSTTGLDNPGVGIMAVDDRVSSSTGVPPQVQHGKQSIKLKLNLREYRKKKKKKKKKAHQKRQVRKISTRDTAPNEIFPNLFQPALLPSVFESHEPYALDSTGPGGEESEKRSKSISSQAEKQPTKTENLENRNPTAVGDPLLRTVAMVGYPDARIDESKFKEYGIAIARAMMETPTGVPLPHFENTFLTNGLIVTRCIDKESRWWLEVWASVRCPWEGTRLDVAGTDRILKQWKAKVRIPRNLGDTLTDLMLLGRLYPDLNVGLWRVCSEHPVDADGDRILKLDIDDNSAKALEALGGKVHLGIHLVTFKLTRH